jgi:hypothetical protein
MQGNFVSAGLVYVVQRPRQAERQPIVITAAFGIMYKFTVPCWQSALHLASVPTFALDVQVLRWVDVLHTGVAGQGQ